MVWGKAWAWFPAPQEGGWIMAPGTCLEERVGKRQAVCTVNSWEFQNNSCFSFSTRLLQRLEGTSALDGISPLGDVEEMEAKRLSSTKRVSKDSGLCGK